MNIQEAIRSGRPFRRPNHFSYLHVSGSKILNKSEFNDYYRLTSYDVLADDWELEEKKIVLTRGQFDQICTDQLKSVYAGSSLGRYNLDKFFSFRSFVDGLWEQITKIGKPL